MTAAQRTGLALLPAVAVFAVYFSALGYGWVWDDPYIFAQLPQPGDWSGLWAAIWEPFLGPGNYLRPLPLLTLGIEQVSGAGPWLTHLVNIALHAASSCLVALLARRLAATRGVDSNAAQLAGAAAGLIYAWHPALVEAVAWASARCDLLLCLSALCLLAADGALARRGAVRGVAATLLFLCAALSKEAAIGLALLLPLWHRLHDPDCSWSTLLRRHAPAYLGVFAGGLAYLALRAAALGAVYEPQAHTAGAGFWQGALLSTMTAGKYLLLSLFPFAGRAPVHYYQFPLPVLSLEIAVGICLPPLALLAWRRRWTTALCLAACWLIALLPVLNLLPLEIGDNYAHERFMVLPLAFFAIGAALLGHRLWQQFAPQRRILALAGAAWAGASLLCIVLALPAWRSELDLWDSAWRGAPQSLAVQANLHSALQQHDRLEEAHALADEVRRRYPHVLNPMLESSDAMLLHDHGMPQLAFEQLAAATARASGAERGFLLGQTGYLRMTDGEFAAARTALAESVTLTAEARPLYFLGITELAMGEAAAGRQHLEQGLAKMPAPEREVQRRKAESFLEGHKAPATGGN